MKEHMNCQLKWSIYQMNSSKIYLEDTYELLLNFVNNNLEKATSQAITKEIYKKLAQLDTILDIMYDLNEIDFDELVDRKRYLRELEEFENEFLYRWLSNSNPHSWESIYNYLRNTDFKK